MKTAKHTPGPWLLHVDEPEYFAEIGGADNYTVAQFDLATGPAELANAVLISQAPTMFEALCGLSKRGLLRCRHDVLNPCTLSKVPGKHWSGMGEACDECRATLAMATILAGEPCRWCKGTGKADSEGCNACDGTGRAGT